MINHRSNSKNFMVHPMYYHPTTNYCKDTKMRRLFARPIFKSLVFVTIFSNLSCTQVYAENWHANGTGRYPDAKPPIEWCAIPGSASKNVIWNRPLPSWSNSSPLIMGDRVFVCGEPTAISWPSGEPTSRKCLNLVDANDRCQRYLPCWREPTSLICLNLADGSILWQRELELIDTLSANEKAELAKVREQDGPILKSIDELIKQRGILEKEVVSADRRKEVDEKIKNVRAEIANIEKQNEALLKVSRNYTKRLTPGWFHGGTGLSTPSPVSDGKYVYVLYGNGIVAAYDRDGNRKWMRFIGRTTGHYGQVASPVVVGDRVIVHLTGISALNTETGETVWHIDAPRETGHNSPIQMRIGATDVIVMSYGEVVAVRDGRKCSFVGFPPFKSYWNSPVVENDTAYFNWSQQSWAGRVSLSPEGEIKTTILLKYPNNNSGDSLYATPVVLDGLLYTLQMGGTFTVYDNSTGQPVYKQQLTPGGSESWYPSLVAVGGYIYAGHNNGTTVVIKAGREFKEVAQNRTDPYQSTLVFHNNRIYIRTMKGVLCIGEK